MISIAEVRPSRPRNTAALLVHRWRTGLVASGRAGRMTLWSIRLRHHFVAGNICRLRPAGLSETGRNALSPRVPVAIRNDAASRIAIASAVVTSTTGAFIVDRSRCGSSPCRVKFRMARRNSSELRGNRHRYADLDRKHREGDDQAQRQRTDRERGRDGVDQSGRGNGRRMAFKAPRAGRPYHGRVPSLRERITRCTGKNSQESLAILRQNIPENGEITARFTVMAAISAVQASATIPAGSSTAASGRQSMATKPRVCSIRRNQARIAGNVARS
jgi:hypothetical protein